jgi:hypothetical protein
MRQSLPYGRSSDRHSHCNPSRDSYPSRDRQGAFADQRLFSRKG